MRINIVGAGPAVPGQNLGQAAQERGGYLILGELTTVGVENMFSQDPSLVVVVVGPGGEAGFSTLVALELIVLGNRGYPGGLEFPTLFGLCSSIEQITPSGVYNFLIINTYITAIINT